MFKRILVPLDGSVLAERTFHTAERLAHRTGGTVFVVRVVPPPVASWPCSAPLLPSATVQTFLEAGRLEATRYLEHLARTSTLTEEEICCEVHIGSAAAMILVLASARDIDLIVLSSHGSGSPGRWSLGSVAEKVVRHAAVPVLLLPDETVNVLSAVLEQEHSTSGCAFVPLDGSATAEAALAPASCLIHALTTPDQAFLHLLLVATLPEVSEGQTAFLDSGMEIRLRQETEQYLSTVRERFAQEQKADHRVSLISSLHFSCDVATAILTRAEQEEEEEAVEKRGTGGIKLIAMTTHGREGNHAWTMGHITARVLSTTHLPLLLVPPTRSEPERSVPYMQERENSPL